MSASKADLAQIRTFPQLVKYLRDELDWPISPDNFDDLLFDYSPEELGIDSKNAAKIQEIKRLRPLSVNQPWGVFFVKFEPKRLPVVALKRILNSVVLKKRASANSSEQAAWDAEDLLFISNYGEGDARQITFAHFSQDPEKQDLPTLKVLGWDNLDTPLHIDHVAEELTQHLAWPDDEKDIDGWRTAWQSAFTLRHREVITTSRELAIRLAELASAIRDRIRTAIAIETETGPLTKLLQAFQKALVHDLDADRFADMYAQTIAYGLLSTRIANPKSAPHDDLPAHMLVTNPFLKELMEAFLHVGGSGGRTRSLGLDFDELGVNEVVSLLDSANMEAVILDFGDRNPEEDPVLHFYELFLGEYDRKQKVNRGVFYTPRPVVSYIVRSVDELLRTEFDLDEGLADTTTWGEMAERDKELKIPSGASPDQAFVQILDPATGTGTFLVEVIDRIHKSLTTKWRAQGQSDQTVDALWNEYVPRHLLPRIAGFELLMAPYAIAHLKVGLKLRETGYRFESDERTRIYLTNALEPALDISGTFEYAIPALAHEAQAVNEVKREGHFTVVVGNPPYSAASANPSKVDGSLTHIGQLMQRYFEVAGTPLGERNPRWLQDDYVKFLRLAESIIADSRAGVVGMITNHGYLENPTFRGMRYSLIQTFPRIAILDLHGNSKKGEEPPNGGVDENVFDIQQGVAVSLFTLSPGGEVAISHEDLWGSRESKYQALLTGDGRPLAHPIVPCDPFYLLVPRDQDLAAEYEAGMSLTDVFPASSVGIVTGRDRLTVQDSPSTVSKVLRDFMSLDVEEARLAFQLGSDSRDWKVQLAQDDVRDHEASESLIVPLAYRPFDTRYTFFTGRSRGFLCMPRNKNMRNMLAGRNLALLTARSNKTSAADHFFATRFISEAKCAESSTQSCAFPLYTFPDPDALALHEDVQPNLSPAFLKRMRDSLGIPEGSNGLPMGIVVEEIFGYAYALFHSSAYRARYSQFLRVDFPRLLFPSTREIFDSLSALGLRVLEWHLLEAVQSGQASPTYVGPSHPEVGRVGWSDDAVWLDAASTKKGQPAGPGTIGFLGVPEEAWSFHIGGYQVCEKWLKDRKGRTLSSDDIEHYQGIVVALSETIRIMGEIDGAIEEHGGWPGAFVS